MGDEFRKLRDLGGSGGTTMPKGWLREHGLVDEEGNVKDEYLSVTTDDDRVVVQPVDSIES